MEIFIDAANEEETRLVVCNQGIVEDFKYQNPGKQSIKGNIYLGTITRVEPSLQAAFVDYGGECDGFLPFPDLHHDYYQIPASDKERLREMILAQKSTASEVLESSDEPSLESEDDDNDNDYEEERGHKMSFLKDYRIQEVIRGVGQVLLVQIKKEGRGKKGATLTTYLSLPGRYSVLMPNAVINTGGISKRIVESSERQRLKSILEETKELISSSSSVIIRTAGENKTKSEIKRDLNYLMMLWNKIREKTLASNAPCCIYEEGDIIQQAIRDLYSSDINEMIIQGHKAYTQALLVVELLLPPKHRNKITLYDEVQPIFSKYYNIEEQLKELHYNVVQLPSGGYLVINQTEALVAIDVNSGRATQKRNVEATAVLINTEAAEKIARILRLMDLSGLIVVDFIDMSEISNKRKIESVFKSALSTDKAKITTTKINSLGILSLSRQRLYPNFWEVNASVCHHCNGTGRVRNIGPTIASIFRAIANEIHAGDTKKVKLSADAEVVMEILNHKRKMILEYEEKYDVSIVLEIDKEAGPDGFFMSSVKSEGSKKPVTKASKIKENKLEEEENQAIELAEQPKKSSKNFKKRWNKAGTDNPDPINNDENSSTEDSSREKVKTRTRNVKKRIRSSEFDNRVNSFDNEGKDINQNPNKNESGKTEEDNKSLVKSIWKQFIE